VLGNRSADPRPVNVVVAGMAVCRSGVIPRTAEQVTFDYLRFLIDEFEAAGEVPFSRARRMRVVPRLGEFYYDRGHDSAPPILHKFRQVAYDPTYVPGESARIRLIGAADQLIAQVSGRVIEVEFTVPPVCCGYPASAAARRGEGAAALAVWLVEAELERVARG
jgi:hypothetical protein